jgi:hypothetical protein
MFLPPPQHTTYGFMTVAAAVYMEYKEFVYGGLPNDSFEGTVQI